MPTAMNIGSTVSCILVNCSLSRIDVKMASSDLPGHWFWIHATLCLNWISKSFLWNRIHSFTSPPFESLLIVPFPPKTCYRKPFNDTTFVKLFLNCPEHANTTVEATHTWDNFLEYFKSFYFHLKRSIENLCVSCLIDLQKSEFYT